MESTYNEHIKDTSKYQDSINASINSILARCNGMYNELADLKRHSEDPAKKTNFLSSINYLKEDIKGIEESVSRLKEALENREALALKLK